MDHSLNLLTAIFWQSDAPFAFGRSLGNSCVVEYVPAQIGENYGADCGYQPKPARRERIVFTMGLTMILGKRWLFVHCGEHVIVPPFPADMLPYLPGMEPDDTNLPGEGD